jgi:hypothetical protein
MVSLRRGKVASTCSCGWVGKTRSSVKEAAALWTAHVEREQKKKTEPPTPGAA